MIDYYVNGKAFLKYLNQMHQLVGLLNIGNERNYLRFGYNKYIEKRGSLQPIYETLNRAEKD